MKPAIDRAVAFAAAVSAPVLTLLVHESVVSSMTATDIGGIVAAAVGFYHTGAAVQRKATARQQPSAPTTADA